MSASYQRGTDGLSPTWMKSVSMYGAFGKNNSQSRSSAITIASMPRRARANAAAAQMSGIQARKRFQFRNL